MSTVRFVQPESGNGVGYCFTGIGATSVVFKDGKPDLVASLELWKREEEQLFEVARRVGEELAEKLERRSLEAILGTNNQQG